MFLWVRLAILAAVAGFLVWLFGLGGMGDIARWAAEQQRATQNEMAAGLRALRSGQPGAWGALMAVCFAYGFFHAAGPGHGKLVIGGYGVAARVTAWRLSALAVASSLAQAAVAVLVVALGALVLGWTRQQMTDTADQILAPASYGAIALVGMWLCARGLRRAWAAPAIHVHEDGTCHSCGHKHGPSVDEAAAVTSWRDALAIVGSVAIRPCTGAMFLLILCFGLGIPWAGIMGAFVMGLGTASITVLVAVMAVSTRRAAFSGLQGDGVMRAMALVEVAAGALIALIAIALVLPFI